MKHKFLFGLILGLALTSLFAFKMAFEPSKTTATVNQYEGLSVFIDSKPVLEYEYLGTVKVTLGIPGITQSNDIKNRLISKAKKEYPTAQAIIISFNSGGSDKADVIKFK